MCAIVVANNLKVCLLCLALLAAEAVFQKKTSASEVPHVCGTQPEILGHGQCVA